MNLPDHIKLIRIVRCALHAYKCTFRKLVCVAEDLVSILCTYMLRPINHINLDQVYHSSLKSIVWYDVQLAVLRQKQAPMFNAYNFVVIGVKCSFLRPNFFGKFLQQQWRRWQSLHLQFLKFPIELVHNVIIDSVLLRNAFNQRTLFELPTFIVWPTKKTRGQLHYDGLFLTFCDSQPIYPFLFTISNRSPHQPFTGQLRTFSDLGFTQVFVTNCQWTVTSLQKQAPTLIADKSFLNWSYLC